MLKHGNFIAIRMSSHYASDGETLYYCYLHSIRFDKYPFNEGYSVEFMANTLTDFWSIKGDYYGQFRSWGYAVDLEFRSIDNISINVSSKANLYNKTYIIDAGIDDLTTQSTTTDIKNKIDVGEILFCLNNYLDLEDPVEAQWNNYYNKQAPSFVFNSANNFIIGCMGRMSSNHYYYELVIQYTKDSTKLITITFLYKDPNDITVTNKVEVNLQ